MREIKKCWSSDGMNYMLDLDNYDKYDNLPVGVYKLCNSMKGLYLKRIDDKFHFPYKIYGIETNFIQRVVRTFNTTNGNLGILLNGLKGTGKTVTAEIICNEINLPVITVADDFQTATPAFINSIPQDIVVFFDEYEKIYQNKSTDHSILTVMDGVLSSNHRKLFILTTNGLYINDNLLSRPSRIRYLKEFKDLNVSIISEIVDDKLKYSEHKEALVRYISSLRNITVDIVKSVIDEVNIHNESPEKFKDVFNVKMNDEKWDVTDVTDPKNPIVIAKASDINPTPNHFERGEGKNSYFMINNQGYGKIRKVLDTNLIIVDIIVADETKVLNPRTSPASTLLNYIKDYGLDSNLALPEITETNPNGLNGAPSINGLMQTQNALQEIVEDAVEGMIEELDPKKDKVRIDELKSVKLKVVTKAIRLERGYSRHTSYVRSDYGYYGW